MTSPDQEFADRSYRSPAGIGGGVMLLLIAAWLGGDAVLRGSGRTPWIALAVLLCVVPLVVAFTLRPAVFAGARRLLVRNPFRTITLPWGCVEDVRAGYSSEVFAGGAKYQLWAIPVSLRKRKAAARRSGGSGGSGSDAGADVQAPSDQAIEEIRELAGRHADVSGEPGVRWAFEVIVPVVVGVVLLVVLGVVG
ncbi:PH domain-containing protein [Streptomyces sp. NPDC002537]